MLMAYTLTEYYDELSLAVTAMVSLATSRQEEIHYEFNEVLLVANIGDTNQNVIDCYYLGLARQNVEQKRIRQKTGRQPDGSILVEQECFDCGATGVYTSDHEWRCPARAGIVCKKCGGRGSTYLRYTPFTGRRKKDIPIVCLAASRGQTLGKPVSYKEFDKGKLPE